MGNAGFRTIKIRMTSHEKLEELIGKVRSGGWSSIGSDRRDEMSITNVIDEIILLALSRVNGRNTG